GTGCRCRCSATRRRARSRRSSTHGAARRKSRSRGSLPRMADEVLTARDGAVLTITFNRPEVYNAFNRELHAALNAALTEAADPTVRCVVVTGAGKGFCAGQDLKEFGAVSGTVGDALEQTYHPNVRLVRSLAKPLIAAVNGPAAGAGLSFACACDLRIAAESATFVPGFVGIGLGPSAGGKRVLYCAACVCAVS